MPFKKTSNGKYKSPSGRTVPNGFKTAPKHKQLPSKYREND